LRSAIISTKMVLKKQEKVKFPSRTSCYNSNALVSSITS